MKILKKEDENFPKSLKDLEDCPDILYVCGNEKILNDFSIAVIGARRCTLEGRIIAQNITRELASNRINIISGLASGIDGVAHKSCIDAKGKTIAVLGSGVYNSCPKENRKLYDEIINNGGAIISEYFPDETPNKAKFHKRNRIIAALAKAVVVIEAKEKSGSFVTVQYAKKLNKEVFVVPGGVNDLNYAGSNMLLSQGEKCVITGKEILKYYSIQENNKYQKTFVPEELREVYETLSRGTKSIDEIANKLKVNIRNCFSKINNA